MSNVQEALRSVEAEIEFVLSASDSYIETLNIKTIEAQPWLVELVIKTQLLSAKNPEEKRIKSRTCIERDRLVEFQDAIGKFLQRPSSVEEPLDSYYGETMTTGSPDQNLNQARTGSRSLGKEDAGSNIKEMTRR